MCDDIHHPILPAITLHQNQKSRHINDGFP